MTNSFTRWVNHWKTRIEGRLGYQLVATNTLPKDLDEGFLPIYQKSKAYTLTDLGAMYGFYSATKHIAEHNIAGDIVECGVWKGGSSMISMLTLQQLNDTSREFYLYDTYAGMAGATSHDVSVHGKVATEQTARFQKNDINEWCYSPLDEVKANIKSTFYPDDKIQYVKGLVEDTIPDVMPDTIAILRLDTDFYQSTYHELNHLYPNLVVGGVLIIDDYGHWLGARKAVDEYFAEHGITMFLARVGISCRIGIKMA